MSRAPIPQVLQLSTLVTKICDQELNDIRKLMNLQTLPCVETLIHREYNKQIVY